MHRNSVLTRTLAVIGTVLVIFPIFAPFIMYLGSALTAHEHLQMDLLMPAELFLVALLGGVLLVWAAVRAGTRIKLIAWSLGAAVGLLVCGQAFAVVSGLASGETQPVGVLTTVVISSIVAYTLALVLTGIGGVLLLRDCFIVSPPQAQAI